MNDVMNEGCILKFHKIYFTLIIKAQNTNSKRQGLVSRIQCSKAGGRQCKSTLLAAASGHELRVHRESDGLNGASLRTRRGLRGRRSSAMRAASNGDTTPTMS